jgi:uncharacterized protein (TIGR02466 family)
MAMNAEPWFPSVIWNADVQGIDNTLLKQYAYQRQANDSGRIISNYGGYQSNDIQAGDNDAMDSLVTHINNEVAEISKGVGIKSLQLYNIWININPPGAYNITHRHQDAVLSGVYYIQASEDQGNINFVRRDGGEYHLHGSMVTQMHHFNSSACKYPAKTGALYIFPGWLDHYVDGNRTDQDRISISFNCGSV